MAWMSDEQYEMTKEIRDKSITARSARHTRTHCGKSGAVKFPSDFLSRKELKAMSGECIKYASLKKPMTWEEFKKLPDDLKVEYIKSIRERFGVPDKHIAEMFGCSACTLSLWLKDLKCSGKPSSGNKQWEKEKFYAWRSGADTDTVEGTEEVTEEEETEIVTEMPEIDISENEAPEVTESPVEGDTVRKSEGCATEKKCAIPKTGTMTFSGSIDDILNTIGMLLNGANVSLEVQWTTNE